MAQSQLPFNLPPADIVVELAGMLEPGVPRLVLDAGMGTGRNARFLGNLGHSVVGLGLDSTEVEDAAALAGSLHAPATASVVADVRHLPFGTVFDVVLMNEVAHLLPAKADAHRALAGLRRVTRQGGLHAVSGYLAEPGKATLRNVARNFQPGELRGIYQHNHWEILHYKEVLLPNQYTGQGAARREHIFSRAMIIAQRPWGRLGAR